jgi:hypothetical protein
VVRRAGLLLALAATASVVAGCGRRPAAAEALASCR